MKTTTQKIPPKAVGAAVLCNILFGSASPAIKVGYQLFSIANDVFTQLLFAGVRFFLAGCMAFALATTKGRRVPTLHKTNIPTVCLMGFVYTFLQYMFFYIGLGHTSGASGSVLVSTSAFFAVVIAHFAYKDDKMTPGKVLGTLLGFAGVLFATLANGSMGGFSLMGEGFILLTALCFVLGSMVSKKATRMDDSATITAYNLLIGGALLILVGLLGGGGGMTFTLPGMLVLLYLAMVSAVGFTIWSRLVQKYPLGKVNVYNFVNPIAGTVLSALFLHENILRWQYPLSLVLLCAGIIIVNKDKK